MTDFSKLLAICLLWLCPLNSCDQNSWNAFRSNHWRIDIVLVSIVLQMRERKSKKHISLNRRPIFFFSLWETPCIIPIRGIKWRLKQMSCLAICIVWSYCVCAGACTQSIQLFESYYFFLFFCCEIVVEFSLWAFPIFFLWKLSSHCLSWNKSDTPQSKLKV